MKKLMVFALVVGLASLTNAAPFELSSNGTVALPSDNFTVQVKTEDFAVVPFNYGYVAIVVQTAKGTISGGIAAAGSLTAPQNGNVMSSFPLLPGEAGIDFYIGDSGGATFPPGTTFIDNINFHMASDAFATIKMYRTHDFIGYVADTLTIQNPLSTCISPDSPIFPLWDTWGQPDCWCGRFICRGDANMIMNGPFRIASPDLVILLDAFNKLDSAVPPGGECANFDLKKNGPFLGASPDLLLLLENFSNMFFQECPKDVDGDGDDDILFWLN